MILNIIFALVLTIALEIISLIILKEDDIKVILGSITINIITNLSFNVTLMLMNINIYDHLIWLIPIELFICVIESFMYLIIIKDIKKCFKYGFILNIFSATLGYLIMYLIRVL
jgi:hypothetical protein